MAIEDSNSSKQHTLHFFDGELEHLRALILAMLDLLISQLEQAIQALEDGDIKLASKVISRDNEVNHFEIKIDGEVQAVLARHCPVANDLRAVIATSKMVVELEKTGNEIAYCARMILMLLEPRTSVPNPKLLVDIVKMAHLIKDMIAKLKGDFTTGQSNLAYTLLRCDRDCEDELQEGIKHQLACLVQDVSLIGRTLYILQIMKSLERCGEHCKNIAEYLIFMIDGIDVRHGRNALES